jgi:hypothetical protein
LGFVIAAVFGFFGLVWFGFALLAMLALYH